MGHGDEIIIRDVSEGDYDQWRILWGQYNEFCDRVGATALSKEIILTTWHRLLDLDEPVPCLVAEQQGQLVGLAHFISHRNTLTVENTCYLQDLFAVPFLRGKGIGRKLLKEFYERAKQAGTTGIYWHTHSSNKTAMRLYDGVATNTEFVVYRETLSKTST